MAKSDVDTARSTQLQRESEKLAAEALVAQREAEVDRDSKSFERHRRTAEKGVTTAEELDRL